MVRKRVENPRKQVGVYIEEHLLYRFHSFHEDGKAPYGKFTSVINDLLRTYLSELENKINKGELT